MGRGKLQHEISGVAVSGFNLFDVAEKATKTKRVVEVADFYRPPRDETDGQFAYYLDGGSTRLWNATLPAGMIRLRVRAALVDGPIAPTKCKLTVGPYVIEGRVNGSWPT